MAQQIQIKRGLKADLPVLAVGELGFCTDTNELYIGTADGNSLLFQFMGPAIFGDSINPLPIKLQETGLILPIDVRGAEKTSIYNYNGVNEPANRVIETSAFDFLTQKYLLGVISPSSSITYYIQESSNQSEWFTTSKVTVPAATTETLGVTTYYNGTSFKLEPSLRYAKMVFVLGSAVTAKLSIQLSSGTL